MMARLNAIWAERSPREQAMLAVMLALIGVLLLWVAVVLPVNAGQRSARDALRAATDRNAAIRARVKLLKAAPRDVGSAGQGLPIDQFIGQSAGEAGLTMERAQAQGTDRIEIAIASVRPVALFSWLATLEAQGFRVETMSARLAPTAGSLSVQAVLARGGGQ